MAIVTKAPKLSDVSFYEAMRSAGMDGCDICDVDWDWGIYLGVPEAGSLDECEDSYDKLMLLFCLNIRCKEVRPDWYSPCYVAAFVEENRAAFDKFLEEENREGYRPSDYDAPLKADEDEGYYEVYMQSMECLIAGNYCESDYEKLVRYLTEGVGE